MRRIAILLIISVLLSATCRKKQVFKLSIITSSDSLEDYTSDNKVYDYFIKLRVNNKRLKDKEYYMGEFQFYSHKKVDTLNVESVGQQKSIAGYCNYSGIATITKDSIYELTFIDNDKAYHDISDLKLLTYIRGLINSKGKLKKINEGLMFTVDSSSYRQVNGSKYIFSER